MDTRAFLNETLNSRTDRSPPVHFAGREREIGLILARAEGAGTPNAGATVVVQGAPGAGKTALLLEAGRRFEARGEARAIYLGAPWNRSGEGAVLERLAHTAFGAPHAEFRSTQTVTKGANVSARVASGSAARSVATSPADLRDWIGLENRYADEADRATRSLVLVDESQTFEDDAGSLLKALHTQNCFPFLLVCGGLGDTKERLARLGLSRLGNDATIHLGAMTDDDVREAAHQTLQWTVKQSTAPAVRHTSAQLDAWADAIARRSLGWPQHLASHMMGVWKALAATEALELSEDNLSAALGHADAYCAAYYADRLVASGTDPRIALAAHEALAPIPRGATFDGIADIIDQAVAVLPSNSRRRHERAFTDAADCLSRMIHAGLIEVQPDGFSLTSPIPTMTAHLRNAVQRMRELG